MNPADLKSANSAPVYFASKYEVATFLVNSDDFAVFHLRGVDLRSDAELFTHIARSMKFPEYFGQNWDALDECLCDMDWCPAPGYVLIVWVADMGTVKVLDKLRQVWESCAPYWMSPDGHDEFSPKTLTPFHLVFVEEEQNVFPGTLKGDV